MTNNMTLTHDEAKVVISIERAQKRINTAYFSQYNKRGTYPDLAKFMGLNVRYVFDFMKFGKLPSNPEIRDRLLRWKPGFEARKMDDITQQLYDLMKSWHVGKKNAIKSADLAFMMFGYYPANPTNSRDVRELRHMIEDINHNFGGCICSSPADGYWWGNDLTEDLKAANRLVNRAKRQLENASHLKRNLQRTLGGQKEIGSKEWFESVKEIPY